MNTIHIIRKLRNDLKISESEMAEYLDIDQSTYSKIESGKQSLKFNQAIKIAEKLKIPLNSLIEQTPSINIQENKSESGSTQYFQNYIENYFNDQKEIIEFLKSQLNQKDEIIRKLLEKN